MRSTWNREELPASLPIWEDILDKFLADASTAYWWISAVVVGLLINLASAYLKDPIDRTAASLSNRWRTRTAARKETRRLHVVHLRDHPESRSEFRAMEARLRLKGLHEMARSCLLLILVTLLLVSFIYKPRPMASVWTEYLLQGVTVLAFLLFFVSVTSATTNFGLANDCERQLREAGTV